MASKLAVYDTGYEDERFQQIVSQSFHCIICTNVIKDAVMCPQNEHLFCRACITRYLMNSQECPTCMEPLTVETLSQAPRGVKNLLSELKIRCEFSDRGCGKFIELGDLERHVADCGFAPAVCSNEGCELEVNKQDLLHHETAVCELRRVKCHSCNDIRIEMDTVKVNLAMMNEKMDRNEKKLSETVEKIEANQKVLENVVLNVQLIRQQLNREGKNDEREIHKTLKEITKQLEGIIQQTSSDKVGSDETISREISSDKVSEEISSHDKVISNNKDSGGICSYREEKRSYREAISESKNSQETCSYDETVSEYKDSGKICSYSELKSKNKDKNNDSREIRSQYGEAISKSEGSEDVCSYEKTISKNEGSEEFCSYEKRIGKNEGLEEFYSYEKTISKNEGSEDFYSYDKTIGEDEDSKDFYSYEKTISKNEDSEDFYSYDKTIGEDEGSEDFYSYGKTIGENEDSKDFYSYEKTIGKNEVSEDFYSYEKTIGKNPDSRETSSTNKDSRETLLSKTNKNSRETCRDDSESSYDDFSLESTLVKSTLWQQTPLGTRRTNPSVTGKKDRSRKIGKKPNRCSQKNM